MKAKLLALSALTLLLVAACAPSLVQPQEHGGFAEPSLSINGTGVVTLEPDLAHISIGVQTQDKEAEAAVTDNNRRTQAVIEALESFGVEADDMQTANFSIFPRQEYDFDGNLIGVTYEVHNTLQVTVRDLAQLGELLDAAVKAGANNINSISFDASDREAAFQQALELAMQNARARADVLAEAAGVEITGVQFVNTFVPFGGGFEAPVERALAADAAFAQVPVASGQLEITVEVNVTYIIE